MPQCCCWTKDINTLILASGDNLDSSTKLVHDAEVTMNDIMGNVQHLSDIINDISQAHVEQSAGNEQINLAVGRLDQMTRQQDALAVQAPCLKQLIDNVTR